MVTLKSSKVPKTKKSFSKAPSVPTHTGNAAPCYPSITITPPEIQSFGHPHEIENLPSSYQSSVNMSTHQSSSQSSFGATPNSHTEPELVPYLVYNGACFTLEECRLICSLVMLNAGYDTASEIIKYERTSPEPVDCAGFDQYLLSDHMKPTRDEIMVPLLADPTAARMRARSAYQNWMEYMRGIVGEYRDRGRGQEVIAMCPFPFRWTDWIPTQPVFDPPPLRTVTEVPYSWATPGWDLGPASDTESTWDEGSVWQEDDNG